MRIGIVTPFSPEIFTASLNPDDLCSAALPSVQSLIHSFLKNGHFVRVFTCTSINKTYKTPNLEVFSIPAGLFGFKLQLLGLTPLFHLKALVEKNSADLDVLHAQWSYETAIAAMSQCHRMPVFHTIRDWAPFIYNFMPKGRDKMYWFIRKQLARKVLGNPKIYTIANSKYTHDLIKKDYGYDTPIIPNSIKDDYILKTERKPPLGCNILCVTTNFDQRKNVGMLIEAFSEFLKLKPEAKLTVITKYQDESTVKNWKSKGLLKNVRILVHIDHKLLIDYYDQASFFVTPSKEETFGNTVIESLSRQVPVIGGQSSGAIPWVLDYGRYGYLFDANSRDSLLQAMLQVCNHPEEAIRKALEGYQHVKDAFSEQAIYLKHIKLYQKHVRR